MTATAIRFNKTVLDEICNRDKCKVKLTRHQYKTLNRETRISFICGSANCNKNGDKTFRMMYNFGGFCKVCMKKIANENVNRIVDKKLKDAYKLTEDDTFK